ncbi:MAG: IPT/TIG domain-containing protein [Planctomycetota bacterium]
MRRHQLQVGIGLAFLLATGVCCIQESAVAAQTPTVTSVSPANGPSLGGTVVTITGTNFASNATVDFGGAAGQNVTFNSATSIAATTPAHAPGAVTVTVTVGSRSGQKSSAFTYSASLAPAISGISPASGTINGGTNVTITGTGFGNPAGVTFGTAPAQSVSFVSATQLAAVAPAASAAGAVDVTVTNPDNQSVKASGGYTYTTPPPGTTSFRFLTGATMPDASTATFYDVQLQVADAAGPVTFSEAGLPMGLSLDTRTGYVSGLPTTVLASGFQVTFTATDGVSTISLSTLIKISAVGGGGNGNANLTFTISSLPQGQVGTAYSTTVKAAGYSGTPIFGADGLPSGLTMAGTTGIISGTPAAAGTFFVTLAVTDVVSNNLNNSKVFLVLPLIVLPADGSNFQFSTLLLTGGEVGAPYNVSVQTANAPATVSFSAMGLPLGLVIVSTNGNAAAITGTPQAGTAGTYLVAITAASGADSISFNGTIVIAGSNTSNFFWNYSGLPNALAGVEYGRTPPLVVNTSNGTSVYYSSTGLPANIIYNSSSGALSGVATEPGTYLVTFIATDSNSNQTIKLTVNFIVLPPGGGSTNNLAVNFWVVKQSIKKSTKPHSDSWQGQYIYNTDRTAAKLFSTTTDSLSVSLGAIPPIQFIPPQSPTTYTLTGGKGKFTFKTPKPVTGVTTSANVALLLDETVETIKFTAKNEAITGTVPGIFVNPVTLTNTLTLGSRAYKIDEVFDPKGVFTPALGFMKTAFVVASAKLTAKTTNKDSAQYSMLLAIPNFAYPPVSANKTIRFRVLNGSTTLIDKTLSTSTGAPTPLVSWTVGTDKKTLLPVTKFKGVKDSAATNTLAKFSYDSGSGVLQLALKNLTLSGANLLPSSSPTGLHTGVEFTIGDQVYYTGVTIFASASGAYSTTAKLP